LLGHRLTKKSRQQMLTAFRKFKDLL